MNKNFTTILTTAAIALVTGCAMAGTWVNGCYIDGPLCTVCDGMKVITHAYGTTLCAHCDGTGIEPPEETVVVENVIVDTWCPPPPPPRWHRPRPIPHRNPPRVRRPNHGGGVHHRAPPARPAAKARPAARPAAPRGGGGRGGGGNRGRGGGGRRR